MKNEFLDQVQRKSDSVEVKLAVAPITDRLVMVGAVILSVGLTLIALAGLFVVFQQIYRFVFPDENDMRKQFRFSRLLVGLLAVAFAGTGLIAPIWQGVSLMQTIFNF